MRRIFMKQLQPISQETSRTAGFTLLEAAIYMTILGLLTAMIMERYQSYTNERILNRSAAQSTSISLVLGNYVVENGRLPCPADPSLPRSHPDSGRETDFCEDTEPTKDFGTCGVNEPVCKSESEKDAQWSDDDPDLPDSDLDPDPIVKGSLPYRALGITYEDTIDPWGGQLSYTVSSHMTHQDRFHYEAGVIGYKILSDVSDTDSPPQWEMQEGRRRLTSNPDVSVEKTSLFAVVSHGPDGKGAYNYSGNLIAPCTGSARDVENCNGTSQFIMANLSSSPIYSLADNDNFFDDGFTRFDLRQDIDKWQYASVTEMQNKAGGKVGIGLTEPFRPDAPLHIIGNLKASNAFADEFCSDNGRCFDPIIIGGTDSNALSCPAGLMRGISDNNINCSGEISTNDIIPSTCPANRFITGFDEDGRVICQE